MCFSIWLIRASRGFTKRNKWELLIKICFRISHTPRLQRNRNFIRPSFAGTSREFAESRFNHKTGIWSAGLSWSHAIPAHGTSWTKVEKCGLIRDFVRISQILCWNRLSANQEYEENEWRFNFAQVENFLSQKNLMFGWIWGGESRPQNVSADVLFFKFLFMDLAPTMVRKSMNSKDMKASWTRFPFWLAISRFHHYLVVGFVTS